MVLYLLNALITPIPVQDKEAVFKIKRVTKEEAREIAKNAHIVSAIGHQATAQLMSLLLDMPVQTNRVSVYFNPNDEALAFVLKQRLQEGQVINSIDELEKIGYDLFYVIRIQ